MPTAHRPANILLVACWFGLITGVTEVTLLGFRKFYLERPIRFGPSLTWMAPAMDVAALVVIALLVAMSRRILRRGTPVTWTAITVSVLAFFSSLNVLLLYTPLHLYAKVILAAGIATQAGRLARRWPDLVGRVARVTVIWLAALVVLAAVAITWRSSAVLGRGDSAAMPATGRPNVLLIVLDTVRAHNMSLHGYERRTTPHLERFAERSVTFDKATATAPWTLTSHASLFTGRWPHEMSATLERPLDRAHPVLAEILRNAGYATAGFVANTQYCGYEFGLSRGFSHYEDYNPSPGELAVSSTLVRSLVNSRWLRRAVGYYDNLPRKDARAITSALLDWLPQAGARPFFAFLNYFDAHEGYFPPPEFANAFGPEKPRGNHLLIQDIRRSLRRDWPERPAAEIAAELEMYDGAIAYLDAELNRLFESLQSRGMLDNTIVVITSDHGEQFGEHGLFVHGNSLYEPLLRVPLIVSYPKAAPGGRRIASRVSLRDVPATILELAGLGAGSTLPGRSLSRFWTGTAVDGADPANLVLSEVAQADWGRDEYPIARGDMASLMDDEYHYILNGDGREELYALGPDPGELRDLSQDSTLRPVLERFRAALAAERSRSRR